jgi:hypothetical protein
MSSNYGLELSVSVVSRGPISGAYAPSGSELQVATDSALECLEWSECDENGEPLDSLGLYFSDDARDAIRSEISSLLMLANDDLHGLEYSQIGHDFILTRNGHGAGFWDRGLGEQGERLAEWAKSFGSVSAYVSDSGQLEIE